MSNINKTAINNYIQNFFGGVVRINSFETLADSILRSVGRLGNVATQEQIIHDLTKDSNYMTLQEKILRGANDWKVTTDESKKILDQIFRTALSFLIEDKAVFAEGGTITKILPGNRFMEILLEISEKKPIHDLVIGEIVMVEMGNPGDSDYEGVQPLKVERIHKTIDGWRFMGYKTKANGDGLLCLCLTGIDKAAYCTTMAVAYGNVSGRERSKAIEMLCFSAD